MSDNVWYTIPYLCGVGLLVVYIIRRLIIND